MTMKYSLLVLLWLVTGFSVAAQTKKIAHKSHSGSNENFSIALSEELFDIGESNFGHAPNPMVKNAILDSVIFVSDTMAILVTSEYCTRSMRPVNGSKPSGTLWRAGREKAPNHPLFSRCHSLDSIKTVLKQQYHFKNLMDSVVFVGYDNNKDKQYKAFSIVPGSSGDNDTPFGGQFWLIVTFVLLLSAAGGWIAWRRTSYEF